MPQWCLRQFGTRDEIAVYDKWTRSIDVKHPCDVASEVGIYDLDHPTFSGTAFETVLGNVENHAASAVRQLTGKGLDGLALKQREDIAAFIVTLQVRVPSALKAVMDHLRVSLDRIRAEMSDDKWREATGSDLTTAELALVRLPSPSAALPDGVLAYGVALALGNWVDELISDYEWTFLKLNPVELITSDTPSR